MTHLFSEVAMKVTRMRPTKLLGTKKNIGPRAMNELGPPGLRHLTVLFKALWNRLHTMGRSRQKTAGQSTVLELPETHRTRWGFWLSLQIQNKRSRVPQFWPVLPEVGILTFPENSSDDFREFW